jgi:hypothetical protein
MALSHCILGKSLGVGCHCFPPLLDVPIFSARCLHVQRRERPLATEGETPRGREMFRQIWPRIRIPRNSRDPLHAENLRHGTDGFTSPPKEGVLRIFFALKNPTDSAGFEPANLGTKNQHATSRPIYAGLWKGCQSTSQTELSVDKFHFPCNRPTRPNWTAYKTLISM